MRDALVLEEQQAVAEGEEIGEAGLWGDALHRLVRNPMAMLGLAIALVIVFLAVVGPYITPYNYLQQNLLATEQTPSWQHWLGTDELGRDFLSRIMMGARTALLVATVVEIMDVGLGVVLGSLAAFFGSWVDAVLMRLADAFLAFPTLLLAVFVNATLKPPIQATAQRFAAWSHLSFFADQSVIDYLVVFGCLALVAWPATARLIRGQILSLKQKEFIEAEDAIGASSWRIIAHHLIPNSLGPIVVSVSATFGFVMLSESAFSYLGIGIQPPGASWGAMINENLDSWRYTPHLVLVPSAVLAIAIFGFNFLGDGINEALNPRTRRG
jgi:peptide/nickel transport system permease protein